MGRIGQRSGPFANHVQNMLVPLSFNNGVIAESARLLLRYDHAV